MEIICRMGLHCEPAQVSRLVPAEWQSEANGKLRSIGMATSHLIHIYPLLFEPGDRLSREEFLERWERMPKIKHAELIDGVVYMPSPVSLPHSRFDSLFQYLLSHYAVHTSGCNCVSNATWLMLESAPQPDSALYVLPEYGGRAGKHELFLAGAPELAVEVSTSSRSYDLGPKLSLYQRAKVQEYVVALVEEQGIEWRLLEQDSYRLMQPDSDGVFRSKIFPGLWVDPTSFWSEDAARLLGVLEEGLVSEDHMNFQKSLWAAHG
jgi:Uma2 family endonuclease